MLPIKEILAVIQEEIMLGCHFLSKIGLAFFVMFIAVEFIKSGIEASSGRGFNLDKKLYLYVFLAILYAAYPELTWELKKYGYTFCEYIYSNFGRINISIEPSTKLFSELWSSIKINPFVGIVTLPFKLIGMGIAYILAYLISIIAFIVVDVIVLAVYMGFELVVAVGPFFIPFFMSEELRHIGKQWMNNIFMYLLQFPLIALVLRLVDELNVIAEKVFYQNFIGQSMIEDLYVV
ncbi:MAG: type IV secretion system protein, partial [Candidatus Aminicenantes bacterium]|nr:type IV secretion system protein [Candidatus Aminicenantes bacterium]